jgi:RNA polymerase sigma-70 factor (ECF subfamily)
MVAESAAAIAALASQISDRTLVEFIADGDKAALRLLYLRHSARVCRFVACLTGSESAAEETVNEVFLAVWRDARQFKGESQVATWLLKIARFKALSPCRPRSEVSLHRHAQDLIEDASDGPAALNEKRRRPDILQRRMTTLTPIHREVINLISCQGKEVEEVAQTTGVPVSTIKTRLQCARGYMAKLFAAAGIDRAWTALSGVCNTAKEPSQRSASERGLR